MGHWLEMAWNMQTGNPWGDALWRASWQGGLALLLVALATCLWRRMPPLTQTWLWRLALLKVLLAFCIAGGMTLAILPPTPVRDAGDAAPALHAALPFTPSIPPPAPIIPSVPYKSGPHWSTAAPRPMVNWLALLTGCWLLGALVAGGRIGYALTRTRRLLRESVPVTDAGILATVEELAAQAGLLWPPETRSAEIAGPLVTHPWRPVVLIPHALAAEGATPALRMILAHELAHIRHHDSRWGWLGIMAKALFFFHPLVHLAARDLQLAQEMACDARARALTDTPPSAYCAMLVAAAERWARHDRHPYIAVGVSESFQQLKQRIMAATQEARLTRVQRTLAAVLLTGMLAATLIPWRLAAQQTEIIITVHPTVEMRFPLPRPLTPYEALQRQAALQQMLEADHAFAPYHPRVLVQKDAVTITAGTHERYACDQLAQTTAAMTQVFGGGHFTIPALADAFRPVDAEGQRRVCDFLTRRLQEMRVEQVEVVPHGASQVAVLPPAEGMDRRLLRDLATPARMEFRLLPAEITVGENAAGQLTLTRNGQPVAEGEALRRSTLALDGSGLKPTCRVVPRYWGNSRPAIQFELADGPVREQFAALTRANIGRAMAIVIDGTLYSAPRICDAMDSSGIICGRFTEQEAEHLANRLNAATSPIPISVESGL